jgi:hypothetical protein
VASCPGSIHVLAARATRLNADGTPVDGATSSYVTGHPMRVAMNADVEEGEDRIQKNGADCACLTYKAPDQIKRWLYELDNCRLEAALFELMFGADLIPGAEEGEYIGNILPAGIGACDLTAGGIGFEFWTRAWDGDKPLAGVPYIRWVVPKSVWRLGDNEFSAEFATITATGYSENNPAFGDPYGDMPAEYDNPDGRPAWFFDSFLPEAACDYAAVGSGS